MLPETKSPFSQLLRVGVLFALIVVAQVPIFMIDQLIRERQTRRDAAVEDVASKWGRQQSFTGPVLVVPYTARWTDKTSDGKVVEHSELTHATFLPERLAIRGRLEVEERKRGIFSVPVYRTNLDVEGEFLEPSFAAWGVSDADVQWERAQLAMGVSDIRALEAPTTVQWNGATAELLPGPGESATLESGAHAQVAIPRGSARLSFRIPLRLKGSTGAYWVPAGKTTQVSLQSNWSNPSFQGNWLPDRHSVTAKGFEAEWTVPYLGRNFPQSWRGGAVNARTVEATRFGVDLIQTVDHYRMAARSVKYAALFLLLTFATLWLVEVLCAVRVHPIQYLLVGAAMCVFYLLELSLSEHLGFGAAYVIATVAVVAQITGYVVSVLGSTRRAAILGGMVAALYGYLYVVLTNEDYALLIGAIGVFVLLATIMRLTRNVDWHGSGAGPGRPTEDRDRRAA